MHATLSGTGAEGHGPHTSLRGACKSAGECLSLYSGGELPPGIYQNILLPCS